MEKFALISVYDKTNLVAFATELQTLGFTILSTGGTAQYLTENGISVRQVSDYTGQSEILDGRVKTLHPKIHGGILARRNRADDLEELSRSEIGLIDIVVVNLYPFTQKVTEILKAKRPQSEPLVELIDIGGPTMIRAAAKNCHDVLPVCDPADYDAVVKGVKSGSVSLAFRRELAAKVFAMMAAYDSAVGRYFAEKELVVGGDGHSIELASREALQLVKVQDLRYGENPHQKAALYRRVDAGNSVPSSCWRQLQGKEISYNNLIDFQAAVELFLDIAPKDTNSHAAVIIKHTNPCGVALRAEQEEAFRAARDCDSVSAFGGIVVLSGVLSAKSAAAILEGFVEVVAVSKVSPEARTLFEKKKNVRLIECDFQRLQKPELKRLPVIRNFFDEVLLQTSDSTIAEFREATLAAGRPVDEAFARDLELAWQVCKHVKSNAIVIVRNGQAIGVGAGQMSRVDSARIAIERARLHAHELKGAAAASDAFLPFADTLEVLSDAGIVGLVQPGGSMRDEEVIASAKARGVTMYFTGERHFRH